MLFTCTILMAVPKKRNSKSKKNSRKSNWIAKAKNSAQKAKAIAKSIFSRKNKSFVYSEENIENNVNNSLDSSIDTSIIEESEESVKEDLQNNNSDGVEPA